MKDREKHILDAARQVFGDNGFYRTKIQDIADEAGIGKGTVYEYFESKEELFCRMVRQSLSVYTDRVRESMAQGDFLARLRQYIRVNEDVVMRSGPFMDVFLSNGSLGEDKQLRQQIMDVFMGMKQDVTALVADTLAMGQAEGVVSRDIDLNLCAEMFLHMSVGYCQRTVRTGQTRSEDTLIRIFLQGVGTQSLA